MLSTFVSELTSPVNSDSAWKVSKGRRSATRRTRNIVGKGTENSAVVIHSNPEHSIMPVSESEKRGVSVLGCSFSDKVEHVPIKKRRFLLKTSPPPPPPPPPPSSSPARHDISVSATKETTDISKNQDASNELATKEPAFSEINSSQITDNNINDQAKKSKKASDILGYDEDFSGISILAAAACSSSSGKECGYVEEHSCLEECSTKEQLCEIFVKSKETSFSSGLVKNELVASREILTGGASSCVSTEPVGELLSLSSAVSPLQNVEAVERCVEGAVSRDVTCSKDEEILGNRSLSSRDDRLHWDLNVMMDDWEQSFEDSDAHNELSLGKSDGEKYSYDNKREKLEGLGSRNRLATTLDKQNTLPLSEPGKFPVETSEEYKEQSGSGAYHNVPNPTSSVVTSHLPNYNNDLNQTKSMVEDANYVHHLESVSNGDQLVTSVLDDRGQLSEAKTINKGEDLATKNLKLLGDGNNSCKLVLDVKSSLAPCELEKRSDSPFANASAGIQTHFCISSNPDTKKEATPLLAGMDNVEESPALHDDETVSMEKIDSKTNEPVGHSNAVVSSEISLPCVEATDYASSKYEVLASSDKMQDASVSQSANVVKICKTASNDLEIQQVTSKQTCYSLLSDSCKTNVDNNLCFSDKIDTVEKLDHGEQACHSASVVRVSSRSRLHEDYDSQYEDGELRETNECAWDEYCASSDDEPMACEEDTETCAISPTHYHVSESGQVDVKRNVVMEGMSTIPSSVNTSENEGSSRAAEFGADDGTDRDKTKINLNTPTEEKVDTTRTEEFPEVSRSSLDIVVGVKEDNERNVAAPSSGDVMVDSGGTETRTEEKSYRRVLRSQIEAPVAHDGSCRDERREKVESRYEESRYARSSERVRYPVHSRGRGRGSWNGSFDGRGGFKRRYSPIFHGRLKGDDDGIVEREDMRGVDSQNDAYAGIHSRYKAERKFSPDRPSTFGRERPFRYDLSAESRAGRGRYNGPSRDEMFQSSLKYRRPLSHRDRSLSPLGGRGHPNAYHSRGKSPSRSRSRSPLMWNSQRGRPGAGGGSNTFMRHRSRSPNFRPEVRLQRSRSPIRQPGFTADRAMGFRSFPRNNYSSPPRGRWTCGRNDESGHFRDFVGKQRSLTLERSPERNIKRTDRPVTDSLRNMKPDGYYRISEEGAGREFRYEENYEIKRKHYGTLCPNRRSFEDDMTNRLHQDTGDSFSGNSIRDRDTLGFQGRRLRGIGCRISDLPRLRGEHHSFMHERERKFNSNSKQFMPDLINSSSDTQSEEQYPSRPGRFLVVDGPSRGRQYENYEDKRKQYGGVFRRNELEGTENRLNHVFDRDFQDEPFFPLRRMRNFNGQNGSLSTRLGEHHDSVMSRQEEKPEDNAQLFGGENSDDHDTSKGRIVS